MDFTGLLATGATAFVASNIDDTFILILLYLMPNIQPRNIIIGQFLGIALLVAISSFAAFLVLAIPPFVIGLIGFIPIILGIKRLRISRNARKGTTVWQNGKLIISSCDGNNRLRWR